jgi:hypothetical protein
VIASRKAAVWSAALVGCAVLLSVRAQAQWWSHVPVDFEECADAAEKAATKEEKTSALAECNAKFAGRRKSGGGYTYFDFMQNRHFDIAGPNPTAEEQKHIDEEYIVYLEDQRRSNIAAALTAKQRQQQQEQQQQQLREAALRSENEKVPVPPARPKAAQADLKPRTKDINCPKHSFSCEWPRLSEGIRDIKKLFGASPQGKDKRG